MICLGCRFERGRLGPFEPLVGQVLGSNSKAKVIALWSVRGLCICTSACNSSFKPLEKPPISNVQANYGHEQPSLQIRGGIREQNRIIGRCPGARPDFGTWLESYSLVMPSLAPPNTTVYVHC